MLQDCSVARLLTIPASVTIYLRSKIAMAVEGSALMLLVIWSQLGLDHLKLYWAGLWKEVKHFLTKSRGLVFPFAVEFG